MARLIQNPLNPIPFSVIGRLRARVFRWLRANGKRIALILLALVVSVLLFRRGAEILSEIKVTVQQPVTATATPKSIKPKVINARKDDQAGIALTRDDVRRIKGND